MRSMAACLFFVTGVGWSAEPQLDELRIAVDKLRAEKAAQQVELYQREEVIRLLTENLAIVRTESEIYQKKWAEAQLRAQTLGVNFSDPAATDAQRQIIESVRALYLAEAERQRVVDQLKRLAAAVELGGDVAAELARTKELLARSATTKSPGPGPAAVESARVVDVNPDLRLVVLSIGTAQGARVGMPLAVMRGDRVVAEVRIVEVRPRISGALIEKTEKGLKPAAGDAVRIVQD